MATAEEEATRHESVGSRVFPAPEGRGRRARLGEQLAGVPELTRALAAHYTSLARMITMKDTQRSSELVALLAELRDVNQRLGVITQDLGYVVQRSLERKARDGRPWTDPAYAAAAATWILAGCIIGALLAR